MALVLVGLGAKPHVDGVAQIQLIFQHIRNRTACPVVRILRVQRCVINPEFLVGVGGRTEDLFLPQLAGDLAWPAAGGAHDEDPADNGGGLLIHHQLLAVILVLSVAVGCPGSQPFPTLRFGAEDGPHLAAGVPYIPLVR